VCCSVLQCVAVCCSVLQCVAVCCSVLQCVAVCCSVLQRVAAVRFALNTMEEEEAHVIQSLTVEMMLCVAMRSVVQRVVESCLTSGLTREMCKYVYVYICIICIYKEDDSLVDKTDSTTRCTILRVTRRSHVLTVSQTVSKTVSKNMTPSYCL